MEEPDEELVRFFFSRANPGSRFTASAKEQFTPLLPRAFAQFVSEKVSARLRSALQTESQEVQAAEADSDSDSADDEERDGIFTTEDELEGYRIVRAIVCQVVPPDRIAHRDTKSYMGILLDDNNRKPICRLWFNTKQKYVGVFDEDKNEDRIPIDAISDIYLLSKQLLAAVRRYEEEGGS